MAEEKKPDDVGINNVEEEFQKLKKELKEEKNQTDAQPPDKIEPNDKIPIEITLDNGETVNCDPDHDKIWAFFCKQCHRYFANISWHTAKILEKILAKKKCLICEQNDFLITQSDRLQTLAHDMDFKVYQYPDKVKKFIFVNFMVKKALDSKFA